MPSSSRDTDTNPSTVEETLGRVGDTLWLAAFASLVAVVALVFAFAALGALGSLGGWFRLLAALVAVCLLLGVLYALFGNWEWGPGGEARQHAVFLLALVALNAAFFRVRNVVEGTLPSLPSVVASFAFLFGSICLLAVAGWLAYLGGLRRLTGLAGLAE